MRSLRHRLAATLAVVVVLTSAVLALGVVPALAGPWQYAGTDGRSGVAVFGQKMHVAVTTPVITRATTTSVPPTREGRLIGNHNSEGGRSA